MASPGYLLVIGHSINGDKMAGYNKVLPPIYKKYDGFYLGLGSPGQGVRHLEGDWFDHSLMLARFNSKDDVSGFWYSPEYEEAKKLRQGGGEFNIFALPGNEHEAPLDEASFLISFYRILDAEAYAPLANSEKEKLIQLNIPYLTTASSNQVKRLEGDLTDHNFNIIAFPNEPSAMSFWNDIEHKKIREKRSNFASFNTYIVKGMRR